LVLPAGTQKIGKFEYTMQLNNSPTDISGLGDLPIKAVNGAMIYLRDVAQVRDGYPPQTNIVHVDGGRSVLLTVEKSGATSTLAVLGETLNIMTLGGLALAVGILVDDATVTIENINWHLEQGKDVEPAILDGARQIVTPAFVSLLCICIAFVPMFFLQGIARFLFVPMAEAVIFAMVSSFILSRTLVPTMARYLLRPHASHAARESRNPLVRFQRG